MLGHGMDPTTLYFSHTVNLIHSFMKECKLKLRNRILLWNVYMVNPVMMNDTRSSGPLFVRKRFLQIREKLIQVAEEEDSDLSVDWRVSFKIEHNSTRKNLVKYKLLLTDYNNVVLHLLTADLFWTNWWMLFILGNILSHHRNTTASLERTKLCLFWNRAKSWFWNFYCETVA